MKKRAFTLVELLVVVAILTILVMLLMPALKKSLQAARDITCRSNLKQIYLMHRGYVEDYKYFPVCNVSNPSYRRYSWDNDLVRWGYAEPYGSIYSLNYNPKKLDFAKEKKVRLYCPEIGTVGQISENLGNRYRGGRTYAGACDGNIRGALGTYNYYVERKNFVRASEARYHSTKHIIADHAGDSFFNNNETVGAAWGKLALAHFDRYNALYLDGHVDGHPKDYLYSIGFWNWYKGNWDVTVKPRN